MSSTLLLNSLLPHHFTDLMHPKPPTRPSNSIRIPWGPYHCSILIPNLRPNPNLSLRRGRRTRQASHSLMAFKVHRNPPSPSHRGYPVQETNPRDYSRFIGRFGGLEDRSQRTRLPFGHTGGTSSRKWTAIQIPTIYRICAKEKPRCVRSCLFGFYGRLVRREQERESYKALLLLQKRYSERVREAFGGDNCGDEMKIVGYSDRFIVPVPKGAGTDFRLSKQTPPFGPAPLTNNVAAFSPDGPGFALDGHTIRWARPYK